MEKKETPNADICPEHNLPYDFICLTDKKQLCLHCFRSHKTHELFLIEDLGKSEEMQRQINSLNSFSSEAQELIPKINLVFQGFAKLNDKINEQSGIALPKILKEIELSSSEKHKEIAKCAHLLQEKIPECSQIIYQIGKKQKEGSTLLPKIKKGYFEQIFD